MGSSLVGVEGLQTMPRLRGWQKFRGALLHLVYGLGQIQPHRHGYILETALRVIHTRHIIVVEVGGSG